VSVNSGQPQYQVLTRSGALGDLRGNVQRSAFNRPKVQSKAKLSAST